MMGVGLLALPVIVIAQERIAGGALQQEASWSALKSLADIARSRADMALDKIAKMEACGQAGRIYAPGAAGADAQGCRPAVSQQTCTYSYSLKDLGGNGSNRGNYGTGNYSRCVAALPGPEYQLVSYDVCYEDLNECSSDGLLCLFSKQTCTFQ